MATLAQSELDIALERLTPQWLAGFFDGEGCITCVRQRGMPSLTVQLSQADYNILMLVSMKFSGEGEPRKPHKKYARNAKKQGWCLQFGGKSGLPFLEYIRPHVILKRRLVEWGIEMAKLHQKAGGNRKYGAGFLPTEIRSRREELLAAMRTENKSGRTIQ